MVQNHTVRLGTIAVFMLHTISFTRRHTPINIITELSAAFESITTSVPIFRILAFLSTLRTITENKHDLNGTKNVKSAK